MYLLVSNSPKLNHQLKWVLLFCFCKLLSCVIEYVTSIFWQMIILEKNIGVKNIILCLTFAHVQCTIIDCWWSLHHDLSTLGIWYEVNVKSPGLINQDVSRYQKSISALLAASNILIRDHWILTSYSMYLSYVERRMKFKKACTYGLLSWRHNTR